MTENCDTTSQEASIEYVHKFGLVGSKSYLRLEGVASNLHVINIALLLIFNKVK
jgi:hypothetical protein